MDLFKGGWGGRAGPEEASAWLRLVVNPEEPRDPRVKNFNGAGGWPTGEETLKGTENSLGCCANARI